MFGDEWVVPAELRKTILYVDAINANVFGWDALHASARAQQCVQIRDKYYTSITSSRDEVLARRALDLALTDEPGATNSRE